MSIGAPRKYYKITEEGMKKMEETEYEWRTFLEHVENILGGPKA